MFNHRLVARYLSNRKLAIISIILAALFGGCIGAFSKIALQTIPPVLLTFLRFFLGSIIITPFLVKEGKMTKPSVRVVLLSFIMVLNTIAYSFGIRLTTATIGQILFSAVPILTALASFLFIKERIGLRKIIGVSIGFLGTVFIILLPVIGKHTAFNGNLLGNMLVFISAICLAWYSVLSKKFHTHYSPLYLTALFIYLTALTNGLLAIPELLANYNFLNTIPFLGWIGVLYVGTFGILFFLLYQYAVKHGSPIIASTLNYLSPVVAFVVASILLGERLTGGFIAGALLALLGVYIVTVG